MRTPCVERCDAIEEQRLLATRQSAYYGHVRLSTPQIVLHLVTFTASQVRQGARGMTVRAEILRELGRQAEPWDVLVIGGGATGLGAAVEAASRGFRTLLVDRKSVV